MNPRNQDKQEAIAAGRNKYQGKPCKHGHNGLRYTRNHSCVECVAAWDVARGRTNPVPSERLKAKRNGETTYQGTVCHRGHIGRRYVANACCVECVSLNTKRYKEAAK